MLDFDDLILEIDHKLVTNHARSKIFIKTSFEVRIDPSKIRWPSFLYSHIACSFFPCCFTISILSGDEIDETWYVWKWKRWFEGYLMTSHVPIDIWRIYGRFGVSNHWNPTWAIEGFRRASRGTLHATANYWGQNYENGKIISDLASMVLASIGFWRFSSSDDDSVS